MSAVTLLSLSDKKTPAQLRTTVSRMRIGVRQLWNTTCRVVPLVRHGRRRRTRRLPGAWLQVELRGRQADSRLRADLDRLVGGTIDEL
jgi:hypothetical protein